MQENFDILWKPLTGYEYAFDISNTGFIRRRDRTGTRGRIVKGKIMPMQIVRGRYSITLTDSKGLRKSHRVDNLVASHFIQLNPKWRITHIDGNPLNNNANNLLVNEKRLQPLNSEFRGVELTLDILKEFIEYKDGYLYKIKPSYGSKIGICGTVNKTGYLQVKLLGKLYLVHRLVFFYHHGYFPETVDHIDNNKLNNRIENLREATYQQNNWNKRAKKNGSSRFKGVYFYKRTGKWVAFNRTDGKKKYLGSFDKEEDAGEAYNNAVRDIQGEFFKHQEGL